MFSKKIALISVLTLVAVSSLAHTIYKDYAYTEQQQNPDSEAPVYSVNKKPVEVPQPPAGSFMSDVINNPIRTDSKPLPFLPEEEYTMSPTQDIWQVPHEAYRAAHDDATALASVNPQALPFIRYVHCPILNKSILNWHVISVNMTISDIFNYDIIMPDAIIEVKGEGWQGCGWLVRWNFLQLRPRLIEVKGSAEISVSPEETKVSESLFKSDVFNLTEFWDTKIFDENYSGLLVEKQIVTIAVPAIDVKDKQPGFLTQEIERNFLPDPMYAPYSIDLMNMMYSSNPVVGIFESTIQILSDDYYDAIQFPKTFAELEKLLGINRKSSQDKRKELIAIIPASEVIHNHGVRRIRVVSSNARSDKNAGVVYITDDFFPQDIQANEDPSRNWLDEERDAGEAVIEMSNGRHGYWIEARNEQGEFVRVDFADGKLAHDYTVNGNGDATIFAGYSCISCHTLNRDRGIKRFVRKDVTMLKGMADIVAERDIIIGQELDVLTLTFSKYDWDQRKLTDRSRADFRDFCRACTEGEMEPEDYGAVTRNVFEWYRFSPVSASQVCLESGVDVGDCVVVEDTEEGLVQYFDNEKAGKVLEAAVPPLSIEIIAGVLPEDAYIAYTIAGVSIPRVQATKVRKALLRRLRSIEITEDKGSEENSGEAGQDAVDKNIETVEEFMGKVKERIKEELADPANHE